MSSIFDKETYTYYIRSKKIWKIPGQFFFDLKCCRQRIKCGWCDKDTWGIGDWFLDVMPDMLEHYKAHRMGSPGCLGENYRDENGVLCNDTCHEEWDIILDRMIILFREATESTCSKKNEYDKAHTDAFDEFTEKYGLLGEKLMTPEENFSKCKTMHFMNELDEYKEIDEKYSLRERELDEYRKSCREEAVKLFNEWFDSL